MTPTENKKILIKLYKNSLDKIRSELMRLQSKYGDEISYGQMSNLNRLQNLDKIIQQEILKIGNKTLSITKENLIYLYDKSYTTEANKIPEKIKEEIGFGLMDKVAIEKSIDNTFSSVVLKNINNFQQSVNEEITIGLMQGKSYDKISKSITDRFNSSASSTMRVIRTEGHKVSNKAAVDVYSNVKSSAENLGYKIKKKWISAKDNRTRDMHVEMDGVYADDNGDFKLPDGTITQAPGLTGKAEHDIRCRCSFITEIVKI